MLDRDIYMAKSIAECDYSSSASIAGNGNAIVSVVGMMHLDGIERILVEKYGYQVLKNPLCKDTISTNNNNIILQNNQELAESKNIRRSYQDSSPIRDSYDAYDIPIIS